MRIIGNDWDDVLQSEFNAPYYQQLRAFLDEEYRTRTVFPPARYLYNALRRTSYSATKVVILGQDPYHEKGQAMGLSFSVPKGVPAPPSLINIYKELVSDCGCRIPDHGDLTYWADQGVLLLNTVLTVREGQAFSHAKHGWETLTDHIIGQLDKKDAPLVFLLWGRPAREKKKLLSNGKHLILESPHPSPLSAHYGFFGNHHFSKTNQYLTANGLTPIDWQIR
jgi:uracil-DNA glycosylase